MLNILIILLGIAFNVLASFFIKFSHTRSSVYLEILEFRVNIFLVLSAALYLGAFSMYYRSLLGLDLTRAQPIFTIGTMLAVGSIGVFFFKESLTWNVGVAYLLFMLGILLLSIK